MVLTEPGKKEEPRREASLKATPRTATSRTATSREPEPRPRWVTKLDFVGARRDIQMEGVERGEAVVSYFKGNEDQWKTGLPTYGRVVYREVWPGIDVEYSGTGQKLKTTYIVKPGADPKRIRLAYRGVTKLALAENGQLNIHTPKQILTEDTPYSYQEINGKREEVRSAYRLRRHGARSPRGFEYGFEVGKYDRRQTLIIDPVLVVYAGYIGGSEADDGFGIAVDSAGNAYVTGETDSLAATFPETIGPDLSANGNTDAFVAKVKADGTGLVYAGFLGGSGSDEGFGIAVDSAGNAYVTGDTDSPAATFPDTVRPDLSANGLTDAFVAKIGGLPLAGIGVYRTTVPNVGRWYLDANRSGLLNVCTIDKCLGPFGINGDRPMVGDWSGNGRTKIGVYRASTNRWIVDYNGDGIVNAVPTDKVWAFGFATDQQVVGDWTGDGKSKIGVFRSSNGMWYLDANGDGAFITATDLTRGPFGVATDKAVAGGW